jgi:predicted RND superfamily exporter protein
MSVPISLVVYKLVFGITYFSLLHILVILIILGIGADDIFVFHDAWEASGQIKALRNDLSRRTAYTFRKSAKTMLVTSLTTMVSFLATGCS